MTEQLAIEYVRRRMTELCHGDVYHLRVRHMILQPNEVRIYHTGGDWIVLLLPPETVSIDSEFGYYDYNITHSEEISYEHRGEITITNNSGDISHLRFLQIIPKL